MNSITGLSLISQRHYEKKLMKIYDCNKSAFDDLIEKSRKHVYNNYIELGVIPDGDGHIQIDVSYDGSWLSHGFSSRYGVAAVIDSITGLILDVSVLSKYCHKCNYLKTNNEHENECQKNYNGSSPYMEVKNAEILWKRSKEVGRFIYKNFLGDGDCKTVQHLNEIKVYGDSNEIIKRECINHISKRLSTALRKLRKTEKLGGKGKGALTDKKIKKLANYYGKAIRCNAPDIKKMKRGIYASIMHCSSTDTNPKHEWCDHGPNSWCFFQRALANKRTPSKHDEKITTLVSTSAFKAIMPTYQKLASEELLSKCVDAQTSNDNESFHHMLWTRCQKHKFCGLRKVEIATWQTVCAYNHGMFSSVEKQLEKAGIKLSSKGKHFFVASDKKRLQDNARKLVKKSKNFLRKKVQIQLEEKNVEDEGGVSYGAGLF
jgi:hypothetical protein